MKHKRSSRHSTFWVHIGFFFFLAPVLFLACDMSQSLINPASTQDAGTHEPATPAAEIQLPIISIGNQTGIYPFPGDIDPDARYLIYLHGRIIEDEGIDPVSSQFGLYEYTATLEYLAASGFTVIADVRAPDTDVDAYSAHVAGQVETLLAHGVPAEYITVVGFSKGGAIAIVTSARLRNPGANFALLAICDEWTDGEPELTLAGRVLSLYEQSDELGSSCKPLADRSPEVTDFTEIEFQTGKRHGTFYAADPVWLEPLVAWALAAGAD